MKEEMNRLAKAKEDIEKSLSSERKKAHDK